MTILPVRIPHIASLAGGDRLLEASPPARDEPLLTEPNERERQGMRAAMKRNAQNFTSGQFFALRRGAYLAAATRDGVGLPRRIERAHAEARAGQRTAVAGLCDFSCGGWMTASRERSSRRLERSDCKFAQERVCWNHALAQ